MFARGKKTKNRVDSLIDEFFMNFTTFLIFSKTSFLGKMFNLKSMVHSIVYGYMVDVSNKIDRKI